MNNHCKAILFASSIVSAGIAAPAVSADDYLDALHDEATQLEYLDESRSSNTVITKQQEVDKEILEAMRSISNFERYFRKTDSATAALYFKLNTQQRLRIYHRFKASKDFELAKKMTIELYGQQR